MYETILRRIMNNQGNLFRTITNLPFTYEIDNGYLRVSRTNYAIPLSDIRVAYNVFPCAGPSGFGNAVRGPSYIWAILNDSRIRNNDGTNSENAIRNTQLTTESATSYGNSSFETSALEKYENRFRRLETVANKKVVDAMREALRIAMTGSDTALIPLSKTLEGEDGLLNSLCADNTRFRLSWGRNQETDKLYKAVQHVSPILPSYVITALQSFVQHRNHAAHDTVQKSEQLKNSLAGLEAYFQFVEWYYTHCKRW